MRTVLIATTMLLAATALCPEARAEDDPTLTAVAAALFDYAVSAMEKKDYATACPRLEEAVRLAPLAIGARMKLGECYEGAGKLATAWGTYILAEEAALKANQPARQQKAHERAEAL